MEVKNKITEQVIYDACKMHENEFLDYYQLFWNTDKKTVLDELSTVRSKIKRGKLEVVCYISTKLEDIIYQKSCINLLKNKK